MIQKLVKYLKIGDQTATVIAISALRDCDLELEAHQLALRDLGGLELLVNLLGTKEGRCVRAALLVLLQVSGNIWIRAALCDMDIMQSLVKLLDDPCMEIRCRSAETIASCAKNIKSRRMVRHCDGINKLVRLLESKNDELITCSAYALWACARSDKNKEVMEASGVIPILAQLLTSSNEKIIVPVAAILQECASVEKYRTDIRKMAMIPNLIDHIQKSQSIALLTHAVNCIFKCAVDPLTRNLVRECNGLAPIAALLDKFGKIGKDLADPKDKNAAVMREYVAAITGAIWKLCLEQQNVGPLLQLGVVKKFVSLIDGQPPSETILIRAVGALGAFAQTQPGRQAVKEANALKPIIQLLTRTDPHLLENASNAIGACAQDNECMAIIDRSDGVRLLWTLLKSNHHSVQASAAWAISPCVEHAKDSGEMVRSLVGGLELMVSLLKSENVNVLAGVCSALSKIAKDEENLAVMTDHGIVQMLAKLTNTKYDQLRKPLTQAIAQCCNWGKNRITFGQANAVGPMVKFLKSHDHEVHLSTTFALKQLSAEPLNCIAMHEYGAVPLLLDLVGSTDETLQQDAASTIANIRKTALAADNE